MRVAIKILFYWVDRNAQCNILFLWASKSWFWVRWGKIIYFFFVFFMGGPWRLIYLCSCIWKSNLWWNKNDWKIFYNLSNLLSNEWVVLRGKRCSFDRWTWLNLYFNWIILCKKNIIAVQNHLLAPMCIWGEFDKCFTVIIKIKKQFIRNDEKNTIAKKLA